MYVMWLVERRSFYSRVYRPTLQGTGKLPSQHNYHHPQKRNSFRSIAELLRDVACRVAVIKFLCEFSTRKSDTLCECLLCREITITYQ